MPNFTTMKISSSFDSLHLLFSENILLQNIIKLVKKMFSNLNSYAMNNKVSKSAEKGVCFSCKATIFVLIWTCAVCAFVKKGT